MPWVENLYLAPSPGPQPQPAAILESSEMGQFLADARARFDLVLIDAPPLDHSNDALLLGTLSDGLVLVTRPGYTDKAELEALLERLLEHETLPLLGALAAAAIAPWPHRRCRQSPPWPPPLPFPPPRHRFAPLTFNPAPSRQAHRVGS